MSRMLTSIFMIGSIGYFAYRFRFRIINVLLGSSWMRRLAVGSMMSLPGVKNKMMQSVFGRPSEW
ncbi:Na+/H+ antiporter [Neobacillus bataviensis LMG 21833]|uniref:Na+/H+ antiporter n=1 Tax=Neobacillus bataviensis LMG 21833 TaxID=1117379 RepID=K6DZE5_9BACI|nr:hypothetical protein [Neobacillus bataviensis]EKN66271.1 Na+/H+ antiporter [Neobacillus bataviensis LMG 21833]